MNKTKRKPKSPRAPANKKKRKLKAPKPTMKQSSQSVLPFPDALRQGKDEMNLANFPIATLSKHVPRGARSIKFQDTIRGQDGKLVKRTWLIQGGSEVGLPTPTDEDVYIALMELSQRQGFDEQQIFFSRYDLVKRLGWCPCGKCYSRLEQSLIRLANVSFHARNAFWDNEVKSYVTAGFTLIEGYHIYNEIGGLKSERDQPNSWIMWSDQLYRSFKSGYVKFLDTSLYFSLQTPLARRLYRYLDRSFGEADRFRIDLYKLAHEHLGMSRKFRYPSEIIRKLTPALEELVNRLYLEGWGVEGNTISFARSPDAEREPFAVPKEELYDAMDLPVDAVRVVDDQEESSSHLMEMLVERGVARREARKLVRSNLASLSRIELAIKYFDSVMAQGAGGIKNPGGFIVSLIREGDFRAVAQQARVRLPNPEHQKLLDEIAYHDYVERQVDRYIAALAKGRFAAQVEAKKREFLASDKARTYRKWKKEVFDEYAVVFCRKDIAASLNLPDFATWRAELQRQTPKRAK